MANQSPQTTSTPTDGEDSNSINPTLTDIMTKFKTSRKYTKSGFWETWSDSWKLYNNERVAIGYDANVDIFIPETYTEVQGIKAHLINGDLEVEFMPTHPEQTGEVDTLQDLFNYAWSKDNMDQKIDSTITEYLVVGNCYIFSYVGEDGLPCQKVVSAKDTFFDPAATNYENLGYGGYRYLAYLDDLKKETITNTEYDSADSKSEPNKLRYDIPNNVGDYDDGGDDQTAKQEREDMLSGSTIDDTAGVVECIVYYDKENMITILNRQYVIENVSTPFQRAAKTINSADNEGNPVSFEMPAIDPFIPVAPFRNLIDPNLWYARGDVEIIGDSQERLNDVQAQKSDNLTYQLNRMWSLDPNFAQKINEIQSVPGAVFTIPPGALEQIPTQPIGADADNEIARIKSEMQAATGSNEMLGSSLSQTGRQSAYQINSGLVMLGARFKVKINNLENEAFRILAQNMLKIMQIYITKEIPIRTMGPNGADWGMYNPGLYLGPWDVSIKLGANAESLKETQRQQMMQFYLLASKLPFINQQDLFQMAGTEIFDLGKRELANLVMPPQPPQTPPTAAAALANTIQFGADLYPDEQAEVLQELDIQPSPYRQEITGMPPPVPEPSKISANLQALSAPQGAAGPGGSPPYEQAGMQTAGSPPVGAPTSGVANIPKVPNA